MIVLLCGLARSRVKLKPLYLQHYMSCLEGRQTTEFKNALITWSWKITWQTKTIKSQLPECLWPPNLSEQNLTLKSPYPPSQKPYPPSHMTFYSRGLVRWREKLKKYISITIVPMATTLGGMVTYFNRLLTIKSFSDFIMWLFKVT